MGGGAGGMSFGRTRSGGLGKRSGSGGGLGGLGGLGGSVGNMGGFALGGSMTDLAGLAGHGTDNTPRGQSRRFYTCTVGRKPSAANFFVDDVDEVSELLCALK